MSDGKQRHLRAMKNGDGERGEAWYYENPRSLEIVVSRGGVFKNHSFLLTRAQVDAWIRRVEGE